MYTGIVLNLLKRPPTIIKGIRTMFVMAATLPDSLNRVEQNKPKLNPERVNTDTIHTILDYKYQN